MPESSSKPEKVSLEEALDKALWENQLDPAYRDMVVDLLDTPADEWPRCCGSDCDPCVVTLSRVVTRVRHLAGTSRPG